MPSLWRPEKRCDVQSPALLIVDDDPSVLRTTELVLLSEGYRVSIASTAQDAYRLLKSCHFDLILLDCIPDRGWVVQEAKSINPNVRVAVCTGDVEVINLPLVEVVLYKPLAPAALLKIVATLLSPAKPA